VNITKAQLDAINKGLLDKFGIPDSPMPNSLLGDAVIGVAQVLVDTLRKSIEEKDLVATGNLKASIDPTNITEDANGVSIEIKMASYWEDVEYGTKPGRKVDIASLENWIRNKRSVYREVKPKKGQTMQEAVRSFAVAIAGKIHSKGTIKRFGYKGSRFIGDVLNQQTIESIGQHLGEMLGKPISVYVTSDTTT
jgi:hypothetical protein